MTTILFIVAGAIQLYLLFVMVGQYKKSRSPYLAFPILVIAALVADNWIVGFGKFIGEGSLLMFLNSIRFVTHAVFTSFGMIFAFGILKRIGIGFAQNKTIHAAVCIFASIVTALGIYMDVYKLQLLFKEENGTMRYVNDGFHLPPIPAIITIIFFMIAGLIVWVKTKSPWVFIGSLIMFILAPIGFRMPILGNIGEIAFVGAMIFGEKTAQDFTNINNE
jgi:hypothetical protein